MSIGIADIAVYLPRARLERSAIAAAHAWAVPGLKGRGKGQLAAANWDEDSVTLAHAAFVNPEITVDAMDAIVDGWQRGRASGNINFGRWEDDAPQPCAQQSRRLESSSHRK